MSSAYITSPDHATPITSTTTTYGNAHLKTTTTTTGVKVPFYPPKFTVFGDNIRKLLKEKYDFAHSIKRVDKKTSVAVDTGFDANRVGYILAKKAFPKYTVEAKASTAESGESKISVSVPRLAEGLSGTLTAFAPSAANTKKDLASTKLEYVRPNFSATTELKTNGNDHSANATASIGFDNITLGGQVNVTAGTSVEVSDYNLGVEYSYAGSVASLWTENQADIAVFNYYHLVKANNAVGAQFRVEVGGNHKTQLTLANEYKLDPSTSVKGKVDFPTGVVTTAFERRLANPNVKFNVAAAFTPATFMTKPVSADKFGIGLTFGDY
jgi:hypothetical protein